MHLSSSRMRCRTACRCAICRSSVSIWFGLRPTKISGPRSTIAMGPGGRQVDFQSVWSNRSNRGLDWCLRNFLYSHFLPVRRRHTCPNTSFPEIDRLGISTVQRCHVSAHAGGGLISKCFACSRPFAIMATLVWKYKPPEYVSSDGLRYAAPAFGNVRRRNATARWSDFATRVVR